MVLTTNNQLLGQKLIANTGYGDLYVRIYGRYNSYSSENGTVNVTTTLSLYLSNGTMYSNGCTYAIDGQSASGNLNMSAGEIGLVSSTFNVSTNVDGSSKGYTSNASYDIYGRSGNFSVSYDTPTVPRYTTANQSLSSRTETTIKINWSAKDTVDYVWYSKDNGTNWIAVGSFNATSGNYTIGGLNPNITYNIKTRVRKKDNQLTSDTSALQVTTYDYPHITVIGTAKLVIGNSQKLTLYNPLNRNVTIRMNKDNADGQQLYSGTITGTSVLFTPNATTLYNSIPNSVISDCVYSCVYGSSTRSTGVNHYIVNEEDCKPVFNDFIYEDVAEDIISLTGNNQLLVNSYSKCKITIPVADKAVAKNGSSIKRYVVGWGNSQAAITYSSTNDVSAIINNSTGNQLTVTVYDSRDLYTTKTITVPIINYIKAIINEVTTQRKNGVSIETYLSFKASIWNGNWSNTDDDNYVNQLKYVGYRVHNGSNWTSYFDVTDNVKEVMSSFSSGNSTSISVSINAKLPIHANGTNGGFEFGKQYTIQLLIKDGNSTVVFTTENYQATLQGTVADGKMGLDRFKDSDGNYHYAVNGIANEEFNFNVNGKFGVNGKEINQSSFKKVWLNQNPTLNFNSQNITLSSSDYDYLIFNYRNNENDGASVIVKKGQNAKLTYIVYDSGLFLYERTAKYVNDTTYQFLDAKFNGAVRNWLCVPVEILGIKIQGGE